VKKYSSAIKCLREKFKAVAAEGSAFRATISSLKWKDTPEAQDALRTVREAKGAGGRRTIGKRLLKPHRRPETGNQRYALWNDKREVGFSARHCLLAMGFLKERPYRTLEPEGSSYPSISTIHDLIQEALGDNEALKAELSEQRIADWFKATAKQEAA
jgi:hypothetical protein